MENHAPKTDEDYKIWMDCVKDYMLFLENWIEENRLARERSPTGQERKIFDRQPERVVDNI